MAARVRFSQERPGVTYVQSTSVGGTTPSLSTKPVSQLLADLLAKPMPTLVSEREYQVMDACTAASIGEENVLRELIKIKPYSLSAKNRAGWTPLLYGAYLGHQGICAFLISIGVMIDDCNSRGQTALMMAAACGNTNVVRLLLEKGASTDRCDKDERQALHYAASCSQNVVVDVLLGAGADPNAADVNGMSPLQEAAISGHELTVISILEKGGSAHQKNKRGEDAMALASDNPKVLQLIADHEKTASAAEAVEQPRGPYRAPQCLADLLEEMNLERFVDKFRQQNVDLHLFFDLNEKDFEEMRIPYGPKKRMLKVIERYRATGVINADTFDSIPPIASSSVAPSQLQQSTRALERDESSSSSELLRSLRFIRDTNEATKKLAIEALQSLHVDHNDKLRPLLTGIMHGVEQIAARAARHEL
ncbi:unnamed protein product [Caenorhabditis auriculariae]|uniref:NAD(+) ADP-ribosyltransferase n=1 Tax=Caenorhabditis auriculariae TaxID=2777116 RepID=A0A8S1HF54_9PELO|nr:unnamed protein product [Caenorhabditis auriculariae]